MIGFVFVFGFAIVLVSGYQATVVPSQNEATEFNHYTEAQNDFAALQAAFDNAGSTGDTYQATIRMGTQYPARTIFLNPAPATGQLSSSASGNITLIDAGDPDGDDERPADDICGTGQGNTRTFEYQPNYNELSGTGRFVFENGVAYRQIDDGVVFTDSDSFIDGTDIDLRPLTSAPSTTRSADTQEVTFKPGEDGGAAITSNNTTFAIRFPSRLSNETWEDVLDDEIQNGSVGNVTKSDNNVTVELNESREYTVTCRAVGIGDTPSAVPDTQQAGTGETTSTTNPSPAQAALVWENASRSGGTPEVEFKNTGNSKLNITSVQFQFYSSQNNVPSKLNITDSGTTTNSIDYGGNYVDVSDEISPLSSGETKSYTFTFYKNNGMVYNVQNDDFFVISIRYSTDGESTGGTYFIAATN
ncbi:hypothetical protein BRD04_05755 [Halobacteriales archaeon QS_9_67_17]|nr:MAG: hypothetical protein BRD04_05755 [Halobacteriales archaeon QS_9_67_17]